MNETAARSGRANGQGLAGKDGGRVVAVLNRMASPPSALFLAPHCGGSSGVPHPTLELVPPLLLLPPLTPPPTRLLALPLVFWGS